MKCYERLLMADVNSQFAYKHKQSTDGNIKSLCTWLLSAWMML